jgi:DNA invertase Pin-like site-specific DNA recombinase
MDRWGRSVTDLLATLRELEHLGVGFVSLTEALDLTTPKGRAMAGLLAIFAEFEREILRERTRTGLPYARWKGTQLGRPLTAGLETAEIHQLFRTGCQRSLVRSSPQRTREYAAMAWLLRLRVILTFRRERPTAKQIPFRQDRGFDPSRFRSLRSACHKLRLAASPKSHRFVDDCVMPGLQCAIRLRSVPLTTEWMSHVC